MISPSSRISELRVGRELDALVAEKIFGLPIYNKDNFGNPGTFVGSHDNPMVCSQPKNYSTSIVAAWEVIERMREIGWVFQIQSYPYSDTVRVEFWRHRVKDRPETLQLAAVSDIKVEAVICLTALKVIEEYGYLDNST